MKRLLCVALMAAAGWTSLAQAEVQPPANMKKDLVQKVQEALPAQPAVKPAKERKLLVFYLTNGFVHGSIPTGIYAVSAMGEKSGAYTAVVSNDPAVFEADSLAKFDAVLMLNTTGDLFTPKDLKNKTEAEKKAIADKALEYRKNLLSFVNGGKGLAGIHAATDTFYNWPEYGQMIGGYFDGHPWHAGSKVQVRVEDPQHPVCLPFEGKTQFEIIDEIYQFKDYSRERQRVLMGLDPTKMDLTATPTNPTKGLKRKDNDYPITWVRTQGQGRVFYCSLGHNDHIYFNTTILKHYLAGLQYALGDLKADASPLPQPK